MTDNHTGILNDVIEYNHPILSQLGTIMRPNKFTQIRISALTGTPSQQFSLHNSNDQYEGLSYILIIASGWIADFSFLFPFPTKL